MAQLDLWLDHYDDIYSDFDSRHYLKRRISEDFLYELNKAFEYKEGYIDTLVLQLPAEKRDELQEKMIIKNLSDFFRSQCSQYDEKHRKKKRAGISLLLIGATVMVLNVFISYHSNASFLLQSLRVLLEPAGWFLIWTAMDSLFYGLKKIKKERNFFKEISAVKWHFKSL